MKGAVGDPQPKCSKVPYIIVAVGLAPCVRARAFGRPGTSPKLRGDGRVHAPNQQEHGTQGGLRHRQVPESGLLWEEKNKSSQKNHGSGVHHLLHRGKW